MIQKNNLKSYLEKIGGIFYTHRNHLITNPNSFSIKEGWYDLVLRAIKELNESKENWDRQIWSIKEKFGSLHIILPETTKEDSEIVAKYMKESSSICEICGNPGETSSQQGWYKTVCLEHDVNMKIDHSERGSGKTTRLIKEAAEYGYYIVCSNMKEVSEVASKAQELKLNIPFPLCYDEFIKKQYHGRGIKGLLIDDIDRLLNYMSDGKVKKITMRK